MTANSSALYCYAMIIPVQKLINTGDKIKYSRLPENTETQQRNTKKNKLE